MSMGTLSFFPRHRQQHQHHDNCYRQQHQYHDHFQPRYEERLAVSVTNLAKTSIDADKGLKVLIIL